MKRVVLLLAVSTILSACNSASRPGRGEIFMSDAEAVSGGLRKSS